MSSTSLKVFDEATAEKKFVNAKNTQESIQGVSSWAMQHKSHHEKIVAVWFNVLKKCKYNGSYGGSLELEAHQCSCLVLIVYTQQPAFSRAHTVILKTAIPKTSVLKIVIPKTAIPKWL